MPYAHCKGAPPQDQCVDVKLLTEGHGGVEEGQVFSGTWRCPSPRPDPALGVGLVTSLLLCCRDPVRHHDPGAGGQSHHRV